MVPIIPPRIFEPLDDEDKEHFWNIQATTAIYKSAVLNKNAAGLTGISVLLASIAAILAALG
jgi:hypothetical protein